VEGNVLEKPKSEIGKKKEVKSQPLTQPKKLIDNKKSRNSNVKLGGRSRGGRGRDGPRPVPENIKLAASRG
jgi:hypothetical protein